VPSAGCGECPAASSGHERPGPPELPALRFELGGQIACLRMRPRRCERVDQVAGEQELAGFAYPVERACSRAVLKATAASCTSFRLTAF
jgi:hypothetical protein